MDALTAANECRRQYGDAHDEHMAMNGECPWCGASTYNTEEAGR
jgi:hypothetical protein